MGFLMAKRKHEKDTFTAVWTESVRYDLIDEEIRKMLETLNAEHLDPESRVNLNDRKHRSLQRKFNHAQEGGRAGDECTISIADLVGAPKWKFDTKEFGRAAQKLLADGRNMNDLRRSRIYFEDTIHHSAQEQYRAFVKLIESVDKDGYIPVLKTRKVRLIPDKTDDYIRTSRPASGYAGAYHADIEIDIGKGNKAYYEIQAMPLAYEDIDTHSHMLFDIIRQLDEIPEPYRTPEQYQIKQALMLMNGALYDEEAIESGFISERKTRIKGISQEEKELIDHIGNRLARAINELPGRKLSWRKSTQDALVFARSSVDNMFRWQENPHARPVSFPKYALKPRPISIEHQAA